MAPDTSITIHVLLPTPVHMCCLSLQPHGRGYHSPELHALYLRHQSEQFGILHLTNAATVQGWVALVVSARKSTKEGDLDCPRTVHQCLWDA